MALSQYLPRRKMVVRETVDLEDPVDLRDGRLEVFDVLENLVADYEVE